jgi:hypothetical protein
MNEEELTASIQENLTKLLDLNKKKQQTHLKEVADFKASCENTIKDAKTNADKIIAAAELSSVEIISTAKSKSLIIQKTINTERSSMEQEKKKMGR